MMTAHEIVKAFILAHEIDPRAFSEWFADAGYPEHEANIYEARYLEHLRNYVVERDG